MTQMEIHQWAHETEEVLIQARSAIEESRSEEVRQLVERLPDTTANSKEPSLALAGQYSAGKSTIIKALTGREDIATGAGITTEQTHVYEWNGIKVVDTPGIHTSVRPEHDDIAYEAISNADLLVFVITSGLFDSHIAEHYRRLTIDRDKGYEAILVVNKMGHHAEGNSPEARAIITEALREPLAPFTPEDLLITYTDAESALEARIETDPELAAYLEREGNLNALIDNLNTLVRQKGLYSRQTTVLYAIDQVLQTAIEREVTDDPDADALALVYNQNVRVISDTKDLLRLSVSNAIDKAASEIRNAGAELAEQIHLDASKEAMEIAAEEADRRVEEIINQLARESQELASEITPELMTRLMDLSESALHRQTFANIEMRAQQRDWRDSASSAAFVSETLGGLARDLSVNSTAIAQGATGLARFSGSATHGAVLNMGHFLGHSFRPWEAVRYASFIGRAAPILAIAGAALSVGIQIWDEHQANRRGQELEKIRQEIQSQHLAISIGVRNQFKLEWEKIIKEALDDPLAEIARRRLDLNNLRQEQNVHLGRLNAASQAAQALIQRIHAATESGHSDNPK